MMRILADIALAIGGSAALSLIAKATIIGGGSLAAVQLARRTRASVRHVLLATGFVALLTLPLLSVVIPARDVGVPLPVSTSILPLAETLESIPVSLVSTDDDVGAPRVAPPTPTAPSIAAMILVTWLMGTVLFLVPMVEGVIRVRRLRRSAVPWVAGQWSVATIAGAAVHRIDVLLDETILGPMTCGVIRPAIVLPQDARTWDQESLERAIVHEMAHIQRWDWLMLCVARVVCAMYWFHPLVWIAWRRLRLEAERACDDAVLLRGHAEAYADQLVTLAERLASHAPQSALAMANRGDLSARVSAVLDADQPRGRAGSRTVAAACVAAALLLTGVAPLRTVAAQAGAPQSDTLEPMFEVAAVKPSRGDAPPRVTSPAPRAFTATSMTVRDLIAAAFGTMGRNLTNAQIAGGPAWIESERFDIIAKSEDIATPAESLLMLRSLLKERFGLVFHYRTEEGPVYALLPVRGDGALGLQLRRSSTSDAECRTAIRAHAAGEELPQGGPACTLRVSPDREAPPDEVSRMVMIGRSVTMAQLVDRLSGFPALGREVIDRSGLSGRFDLELRWMPPFGQRSNDVADSTPVASGPSIFEALERQLGLKLNATRGPIRTLVIDQVTQPKLD